MISYGRLQYSVSWSCFWAPRRGCCAERSASQAKDQIAQRRPSATTFMATSQVRRWPQAQPRRAESTRGRTIVGSNGRPKPGQSRLRQSADNRHSGAVGHCGIRRRPDTEEPSTRRNAGPLALPVRRARARREPWFLLPTRKRPPRRTASYLCLSRIYRPVGMAFSRSVITDTPSGVVSVVVCTHCSPPVRPVVHWMSVNVVSIGAGPVGSNVPVTTRLWAR